MISKNKSKYFLFTCVICVASITHAFAAPNRSTPSKIKVPSTTPAQTVEAPVQKNEVRTLTRKATPSKIAVTAQSPIAPTASEDVANQKQAQKETVPSAPVTEQTTPTVQIAAAPEVVPDVKRRPTPSKIQVNASITVATASEVETTEPATANNTSPDVQDADLAVALLPPSESQSITTPELSNGVHLAASKKIKPYKEGAEIYVVDSAIASGNEFDVDLLNTQPQLDNDIVIADADEVVEETKHDKALRVYLSTPSKIPVSAINKHSEKSSQLPFDVQAGAALVVDQDTGEVIYSKSAQDVLPIASISKLMTAMVVLDAKQSMNEKITITSSDVDTLKKTTSRLSVGTKLTRKELLHLSLMSSENRAAHALARNYPGGEKAFVKAMNAKAKKLGLTQTTYVEPTGLSPKNRSSARDLVWLVKAAYNYPLIKQYSTASSKKIMVGKNSLNYKNSNQLIDSGNWSIGVQKTGYIREAGYCMVAQTAIGKKRYIMVFLNANARSDRVNDAEKIRAMIKDGGKKQYASNAKGPKPER